MSVAPRIASLVVAPLLSLAGVVGAAYVALIAVFAAQRPDPHAVDGDTCCGAPATWHELIADTGWVIGAAAVVGIVFALSGALWLFGRRGRWPAWEKAAAVPVTAAAFVGALIWIAIAIQ